MYYYHTCIKTATTLAPQHRKPGKAEKMGSVKVTESDWTRFLSHFQCQALKFFENDCHFGSLKNE